MSEYKSLTHHIVDMLETKRTSIKNVPRNEKTDRKNLPIVARKGNIRDDGTQTKQDEIQSKVIDETKIAQSKKPAANVKNPKKLDISDVGKQPPTKVEINPELEKTNVFSSTEVKGNPLTEGARVSIQHQSDSGVWITSQTSPNTPTNILNAMKQVQKAHDTNRVRAIDARGSLVDMLAQQPVQVQPAQLPFGNLTTPKPTFKKIDFPERKERMTFGRALGMWLTGEETLKEETLTDKARATFPKTAAAYDKVNSSYKALIGAPSIVSFATQKDVLPAKMVTDYIAKNKAKAAGEVKKNEETELGEGSKEFSYVAKPALKKGKDVEKGLKMWSATNKYRDAAPKNISKYKEHEPKPGVITRSWTYNKEEAINELSQKTVQAYKEKATSFANKDEVEREALADNSRRQTTWKRAFARKLSRQAGVKAATKRLKAEDTIYRALDRVIEARHHDIETDEPKFSQSIQKVAAHAKTYADVEHTYKHKDGSKTKVNQELGEKIHTVINSTPNRHKADLIQKMHKSASHLKDALKEEHKKLPYKEFIKGRKSHHEMSTDELRDTGRRIKKSKMPGSKFYFKKAKEREPKNEAYPDFYEPTTQPYGTKEPKKIKLTAAEKEKYKNKKPSKWKIHDTGPTTKP